MNPLQSLLVDGELRSLSRFVVPDTTLSSSRATMTRHSFVITANAAELMQYLEPAYGSWTKESIADDAQSGGAQEELAEAGYPDLDQLAESPRLLELLVGRYLLQDGLGKLTWDGSSPIEYWFDEVNACHSDGKVIQISGICFSKRPHEA